MPREIKTWPPESRRYISENLLCPQCGNTTAFAMDLRLKHLVEPNPQGLEISLSQAPTQKVLNALARNLWRVLDKGSEVCRPRIQCANCGEMDYLDLHERILDTCWQIGCPGCWWCGNWIEEDSVLELCRQCVIDREGKIDSDDCYSLCPNYDSGLGEVRNHYGLSLDQIKHDLGYQTFSAGLAVE